MAENTKIEWCDHTINFWWGCSKISPACANCYAEAQATRFHAGLWGPEGERRVRVEAARREALRYEKRAAAEGRRFRVFTNSMSDFFEDRADLVEARQEALDIIMSTPHLDWLILTKRPERVLPLLAEAQRRALEGDMGFAYTEPGTNALSEWLGWWLSGKPPANVWLGTTAEDQVRADLRIPALLGVPAAVRFLSCEPLLGPVDLRPQDCWLGYTPTRELLHWVIAGGESGPHARPVHPDWARGLRDQCAAAGVPFLFKQWGEWAPFVNEDHYTRGGAERHAHAWVEVSGKLQGLCWVVDDDGTWSNYTGKPPLDSENELSRTVAVMGRHGKKTAGRILDRVEHNGFPEVAKTSA